MSKEIKFRIWDKDSGYFIKVSDTNKHYLSLNGDIIIIDEMGFIYETDKENYIINKYTGLKDKNGTEIYEGDILRYRFPYDRRLKHVSPVKFIETEASFGLKDIYGNEIPLYRITANNYFEVVGNIYENRELLEGKDD